MRDLARVPDVCGEQAQRKDQERSAFQGADLMLAEWFGGRDPSPGADIIWDQLRGQQIDETLQVIRWDGLVEAGSHAEAARRGLQRLEGKAYVVRDGDEL